jgi:hypothetical protein
MGALSDDKPFSYPSSSNSSPTIRSMPNVSPRIHRISIFQEAQAFTRSIKS